MRSGFYYVVLALLINTTISNIGGAVGDGKKDLDAKPTFILAAGGTSEYVIVVSDGEDPQDRVKDAANLLQSMLMEAAGCKLPIVKEAEAPADKPAIYLGKTTAAKKAGVPVDGLKEWTFCKRAVGKNLFLAGLDASANITNRPGNGYRGTLKAVTSFLEDEVGIRFLLPGTNGIYVPKLDEIKVNAELNITASPKIPYCYGRIFSDVYSVANNHFDIVFYKTYGGHSYYSAVPLEKYGKTHPEYFALQNGKRTPEYGETINQNQKSRLCISNPEVQELMLKEMEKQLDLGYEWVQLAQTDRYGPCECANCKAIAGDDFSEALWIVHRKLAEEMKKRRPGKKVVILSYGPTYYPPNSFNKFPDNVVIEMCKYAPEDFKRWEKFNNEKVVYIYNWGSYHILGFLPKRTPNFAAKQLRLFAANNIRGIYKCGFGEALGLEGPAYYVYGKLLLDPDADPQKLADDFYRAAYGKAVMPMKAFFDALYKRLELYANTPIYDHPKWDRPPFTDVIYHEKWMVRNPEDMICYFFPPELVLFMEDKLNLAFGMDNDPRVQARLRLLQREFLYLKNMAAIFAYYRAYRLAESPAVFDLLETELNRRNALIDSWYVENEDVKTNPKAPKWKMKVEDGWPSFFGNTGKDTLRSGGIQGAILSAPFTWDMKALREKKFSSASANRAAVKVKIGNLKIARLAAPVTVNLDGLPDEETWKKAIAEELVEIELGPLKETTSFKAAYDDNNIYFSFVCQYSDIEQAKFTVFGRDGSIWGEDCIEIFLDPFGTREKYFHFAFNPVAGSFYDARRGFITDPLDPEFGKEDPSWNGDWEYITKVDKENKRWTAEVKIPFATLGVPAPKPGANWTMNIGREHPEGTDQRGSPRMELSLWSPNLAERSFDAPLAFGTLTFE